MSSSAWLLWVKEISYKRDEVGRVSEGKHPQAPWFDRQAFNDNLKAVKLISSFAFRVQRCCAQKFFACCSNLYL